MSTRRALLAGAAGLVVAGAASAGHPDATLLALCARLGEMQAEWQRLWTLTSDGPAIETEADRIWQDYADNVWPGVNISHWDAERRRPDDLPAKLLTFRATTPEGLQAKAAAILALDDAAGYQSDYRNDAIELWLSLGIDAAGPARRLVGEEA